MRHFHLKRNKYFCPTVNLDKIWSLVSEQTREQYKGRTDKAPIIDAVRAVSATYSMLGGVVWHKEEYLCMMMIHVCVFLYHFCRGTTKFSVKVIFQSNRSLLKQSFSAAEQRRRSKKLEELVYLLLRLIRWTVTIKFYAANV